MLLSETILITGGAGFIGSRLVAALAEHNQVRILDTLDRNAFETTELATHPNVTLIQGDVRNIEEVRHAAEGVTRILHLASIAGVETVRNQPVRTMLVIIEGTRSVLEVAKELPLLKRVVTFSTSEVYGRFAYDVKESHATPIEPVSEPRWTYAVAKITAEHLGHAYFREHGVPVVSVRPFNIYGPGQVGEGAIHAFVNQADKNAPLTVNFDGQQIRAWCYVTDIVDATITALSKEGIDGEVFNIGNPRETVTVLQLAELILKLTGSESQITHAQPTYPDVQVRVPNVDKAREILGFEPVVRLEEGLRETIAWYRNAGR